MVHVFSFPGYTRDEGSEGNESFARHLRTRFKCLRPNTGKLESPPLSFEFLFARSRHWRDMKSTFNMLLFLFVRL